MFQSTHPCGVRLTSRALRNQGPPVSIHAPLRGATSEAIDQAARDTAVSIHAPLRGATDWLLFVARGEGVSIHAPLRGATPLLSNRDMWGCSFNPRTPAGCDFLVVCCISTYSAFQSTHPCGVRLCSYLYYITSGEFQSTHPCGVRHSFPLTLPRFPGLNPRTPAGCDNHAWDVSAKSTIVSIHAPLRGATIDFESAFAGVRSFNPRTPAGCDRCRPKKPSWT